MSDPLSPATNGHGSGQAALSPSINRAEKTSPGHSGGTDGSTAGPGTLDAIPPFALGTSSEGHSTNSLEFKRPNSLDTSAGPLSFGDVGKSKRSPGIRPIHAPDIPSSRQGLTRVIYKGENVLRQGVLWKWGNGIMRSWKQRYFVLTHRQLYYFKAQESFSSDEKPRGVISLTDCSIATAEQHTKREFSFGLFHTKQRDYFLAAENESDMVDWIHTVETHCLGIIEEVTLDDFELMMLVGKGSFGRVIQVRKRDSGKIYAMKVLDKKDIIRTNQVHALQAERRVLEVVNHPFIVKLHFAFQNANKLAFVLDFVNGGELFTLIKKHKRFEEQYVKFYAAEIILALEYLHHIDIIYRDLKPENILLDMHGHIRLTDFGLSKEALDAGDRTFSVVGSPFYMAPEIVLKKGHGKAVDWWSLGVLMYEMLTGLPPFYSENMHTAYQRLLREEIPMPSHLSGEAKSLLTSLLQRNPSKRLGGSSQDAFEIKKHAFFKDVDWETVLSMGAEPPFKPDVKGIKDVSNFDLSHLGGMNKLLSVAHSSLHGQEEFDDFDFVASIAQHIGQQPRARGVVEGEEDLDEREREDHAVKRAIVAANTMFEACGWNVELAATGIVDALANRLAIRDVFVDGDGMGSSSAVGAGSPRANGLSQLTDSIQAAVEHHTTTLARSISMGSLGGRSF